MVTTIITRQKGSHSARRVRVFGKGVTNRLLVKNCRFQGVLLKRRVSTILVIFRASWERKCE